MNVSNTISILRNFNNKTTQKAKTTKEDYLYEEKDAVRVFIDPRVLASKAFRDILEENNHYPIINPDVLLYDDRLYLKRYSKI